MTKRERDQKVACRLAVRVLRITERGYFHPDQGVVLALEVLRSAARKPVRS